MANCLDYDSNSIKLDVLSDGSVNVEYKIAPDQTLAQINVTLPCETYTDLIAVDENGIILDWNPNNEEIEVDSLGSEEVSFFFSSTALTNKTGSKWIVSIDSDTTVNYVLPLDAVLTEISSPPLSLTMIDNQFSITLPQGISSIAYTLGASGTKVNSIILLYKAEDKIKEANELNIDTTEFQETLDLATQSFDEGLYLNSERYSQQIIDQCGTLIETAMLQQENSVTFQSVSPYIVIILGLLTVGGIIFAYRSKLNLSEAEEPTVRAREVKPWF